MTTHRLTYVKPIDIRLNKDGEISQKIYLTADFETIVHNHVQHAFAASIGYYSSNKLKSTSVYINTLKLDEELSNIEELSDKMLLRFYVILKACIKVNKGKSKNAIVYFHNMSRFDSMYIFKLIKLLLNNGTVVDTDIKIVARNGVYYEIKVKNIIFRDSYALLPISLENLSQVLLNEGKLDMDFNFTYDVIVNNVDSIRQYCNHDSELLFKVLKKFQLNTILEFQIDPLKSITTSSLALKIIKTHYLKEETIENTSYNQNVHNFVKESYRGGLSTIFKPYHRSYKLKCIDINSSYPYSMTKKLPVGKGEWIKKAYLSELNQGLNNVNNLKHLPHFGFMDVTIRIENNEFNISPLIALYEGHLTDVVGQIRMVLFTEEINFILENGGHIVKIHAYLRYKQGSPLKDFAEDVYKKRVETNSKDMKFLYKLILNSSYGRWALKTYDQDTVITTNETYSQMDEYSHSTILSNIGKKFSMFNYQRHENLNSITPEALLSERSNQLLKPKFKHADRAIQIASAISSYSRINLMKTVLRLSKLGCDVYYVDTDSIHFNNKSNLDINTTGLIHPNQLGKWGVEQADFSAIYLRPKFYIMKRKDGSIIDYKIKGLPKKAILEHINSMTSGNDQLRDKMIWNMFETKFRGGLFEVTYSKNFIRSLKTLSIQTKPKVQFRPRGPYTKRIQVFDNKGIWSSTKPHRAVYDMTQGKLLSAKYVSHTGQNISETHTGFKGIENLSRNIDLFIDTILETYGIDRHKSVKIEFRSKRLADLFVEYLSNKHDDKYDNTRIRTVVFLSNGNITSSEFRTPNKALEYLKSLEEIYSESILNHSRYILEITTTDVKSYQVLLNDIVKFWLAIINNSILSLPTVFKTFHEFFNRLNKFGDRIEQQVLEMSKELYEFIWNSVNKKIQSRYENEVMNIDYLTIDALNGMFNIEAPSNTNNDKTSRKYPDIISQTSLKPIVKKNIVKTDVIKKEIVDQAATTNAPELVEGFKWISDIDNDKHYNKAYEYYVLLNDLKLEDGSYKKLRNSYKNALNYYKKKYDQTKSPPPG